jgi:hypothetical protein
MLTEMASAANRRFQAAERDRGEQVDRDPRRAAALADGVQRPGQAV